MCDLLSVFYINDVSCIVSNIRPSGSYVRHVTLGLGRFGFFKFRLIRFGFQSQVLGFGFFRFRYLQTTTMQEYPSVWKHQGVDKLRQKVSVKAYWPTTLVWSTPSHSAWSICLLMSHPSTLPVLTTTFHSLSIPNRLSSFPSLALLP